MHKRLEAAINALPNPAERALWRTDLFVDVSTNKVAWAGPNAPDNVRNNPNVQQVDFVRLEPGKNFVTGDPWDLTKVNSIHEVKTSARNRFEDPQRSRYLRLSNDGEKLHLHFTKYTYDETGGKMVVNQGISAREKAFAAIGLAGTTIVTTVWAARLDDWNNFQNATAHAATQAGKLFREAERNLISPHTQRDAGHAAVEWNQSFNNLVEGYLPPTMGFDGGHLAAAAILKAVYLGQ